MSTEEGGRLEAMVSAACQAVVTAEADLNALDTGAGDGDCGSTLARGAKGQLSDSCFTLVGKNVLARNARLYVLLNAKYWKKT